MLVLSRRKDESIIVGEDMEITIVDVLAIPTYEFSKK